MSQNPPDDKLEKMRKQLLPHFKTGFLQRNLTIFQVYFDQGDKPFYLSVEPADFSIIDGEHPSPTLTIHCDDQALFWSLLSGRSDGMLAFMDGRYRADGHIVLSQLLLYLFRDEQQVNIYEVQD